MTDLTMDNTYYIGRHTTEIWDKWCPLCCRYGASGHVCEARKWQITNRSWIYPGDQDQQAIAARLWRQGQSR